MLGCKNGIQHNGKITAGRVFHSGGNVKAARDKPVLLIGQVVLAAFGEEIAYRGFFFGKASKLFPVWVCAVVSSAVFAAGHIAPGDLGIVVYDIAGVFIDSLIFSVIYHKSGNCVISTFSHILGNAISMAAVFTFF